MQIIGAAAKLGIAYSDFVEPHQRFTGTPIFDRLMTIDYALAAAKDALTMAGLSAQDLDVIITASISTDHVSDEVNIVGPRLCHPLQRELGADNAVVFDLQDACWVFSLDVAQSFLRGMGFKHALVLRGDCLDGMDVSGASGLGWQAGAGAVIINIHEQPCWQVEYHDMSDSGSPARVELLDARRRFRGQFRTALYFSPTERLRDSMDTVSNYLLSRINSPGKPLIEPWDFHMPGKTGAQLGPYALPIALSSQNRETVPSSLISFDPFRLRMSACTLEVA